MLSFHLISKNVKTLISFTLVLAFLVLFFNAYAMPQSEYCKEDRFLYFGRYPQSKISNVSDLIEGKDYINLNGSFYKLEAIKWKVIKEDDTSLLVVSEKNLDVKPFCVNYSSEASWSNSDIAKWLNSDVTLSNLFYTAPFAQNGFLSSAFTKDESAKILDSSISYIEEVLIPFAGLTKHTKLDSNQKIFLLSQDDLHEYEELGLNSFNVNAPNTDFVNSYSSKGLDVVNSYWLRDSLSQNTLLDSFETAFIVNENGKFDTKWVKHDACVRPAIRIDKSILID